MGITGLESGEGLAPLVTRHGPLLKAVVCTHRRCKKLFGTVSRVLQLTVTNEYSKLNGHMITPNYCRE